MEALNISVLYLDDEVQNLQSFSAAFRKYFTIYTAQSVAEAEEIIGKHDIHIAISDHKMPGMSGVEFLEILANRHPDIIRILLTAFNEIDMVIEAINRGQVYRFFTKPWNKEEIISTMYGAYKIHKDRIAARRLNEQLLETNEQLEFMLRQRLIS